MLKLVFLFFSLILCSWDDVSAAPYNPDWGSVGVFTDAQTCAGCHRATPIGEVPSVMRFPDAQGEDISPPYQWRHSMMANAFNDPYYQAVIEDEATLFSGLAGLVEDTCLTCHSPMAHTNAHQTGADLSQDASCTLADGCYRLTTASAQNHAREGVSCTLCHQIEDDNLGSPASFSGGFSIAAAGDADAFTIYGPYQNPHTGGANLMQSNTGYTPQFGTQMTSSAHCASCHTLYTPVLDANGDPVPIPGTDPVEYTEFPEQTTYLEWEHAGFTATCQDCHLPDARGSVVISNRPPTLAPRTPFGQHHYVGGNSYMVNLLKANAVDLGVTADDVHFDDTIARTLNQLEVNTALVTAQANRNGDRLLVTVEVINIAGHKLPSGLP